ncbi:MAG: VOC family protein [Spirochaetaceae bacterium]|nr:VOC family protein [Spirochaetaceae bacterium]
MRLNHLGYAAREIRAATEAFLGQGYVKVHEEVKHHVPKNMYVQRVRLGDTIVEIMAPADLGKPSFVSGELETTSAPFMLHHLCYDVEDIRATVDALMATGEYEIFEPITKGVFQDNLICFLRHRYIGLVEFFEWPKA